eukprot:scaffold22875_cov27-Phaeocystis_antarctica.AAC.1
MAQASRQYPLSNFGAKRPATGPVEQPTSCWGQGGAAALVGGCPCFGASHVRPLHARCPP